MSGKNVVTKEDSAFCHYGVFHLLRSRYKNVQKLGKLRTVHALGLVFSIRRHRVICCSEKEGLAGFKVPTSLVGHAWAIVHKARKLESLPQIQFMSSPEGCVFGGAIVVRESFP